MYRPLIYTETLSPTVFPDWAANNVQAWWQEAFDDFKAKAEYDGIWLDMNEPSSFSEAEVADHMKDPGAHNGEGAAKKIKVQGNKFDYPAYEVSPKAHTRDLADSWRRFIMAGEPCREKPFPHLRCSQTERDITTHTTSMAYSDSF